MRRQLISFTLLALVFSHTLNALTQTAVTNSLPVVIDPRTPRDFPSFTNRAEWQEHAQQIREQILVNAGLWHMPEKTPLDAHIFGKIERDGYSIEKVYFQTYPGFYLCGNLYRPLGHGNGPFPAILSPHGHWEHGRLEDTAICSIPARCINFARQGIIAFAYDLVGYNDTHFADAPTNLSFTKIHRSFATINPAAQLWNVTLMGLQTWNSERALDFLASLPDADPHRLGVTGESGGGTQAFMLGAIDDRLAAQSPVVMVSHVMQGGCICENMPGLRIEFSNMEIAAAAAPRPQLLVGATGDWTRTMTNYEGPALAGIYKLFDAPDNLRYVEFPFPHNCNQTSREALYQWFDHTLLDKPDEPVKELAYQKEPDENMRVFPDGKLPPGALTEAGFIKYLIGTHQAGLRALEPSDKESLQHYKSVMRTAWERTMQLEWPDKEFTIKINYLNSPKPDEFSTTEDVIAREGGEEPLKALVFAPRTNTAPRTLLVMLADPKGKDAYCDEAGAPKDLARRLLDAHYTVAVVESFPQMAASNETTILFDTYNRTYLQSQVRRLATLCQGMLGQADRVVLCGFGQAGLWSLMVAPRVEGVIADGNQVDVSDDQNLLAPGIFCPGIRNLDTFNGALILAAPHPLLLHNVADTFPTSELRSTYKILGAEKNFRAETHPLTDEEIVAWISEMDHARSQ